MTGKEGFFSFQSLFSSTHCPNISAAEGGVSCSVDATEVLEWGDSSDRNLRCVAAHNASAWDGRRKAAMIADGRLKLYFSI